MNKLGTSLDMSESLSLYRHEPSQSQKAESEGLAGRFTTVGNEQNARTH